MFNTFYVHTSCQCCNQVALGILQSQAELILLHTSRKYYFKLMNTVHERQLTTIFFVTQNRLHYVVFYELLPQVVIGLYAAKQVSVLQNNLGLLNYYSSVI